MTPIRTSPDALRPASTRRDSESGETLLLTLIWAMAALVGALALARSIVGTVSVTQGSTEETAAVDAAERIVQEFEQHAFQSVFQRFNGTEADDPGTGPSPGAGFAVEGLEAVDGDADGLPGEIVFPTASGDPSRLCEFTASTFAAGVSDLDLDGAETPDELVTAAYRVLPVVVRVRWRSLGGERSIELGTVLAEAQP